MRVPVSQFTNLTQDLAQSLLDLGEEKLESKRLRETLDLLRDNLQEERERVDALEAEVARLHLCSEGEASEICQRTRQLARIFKPNIASAHVPCVCVALSFLRPKEIVGSVAYVSTRFRDLTRLPKGPGRSASNTLWSYVVCGQDVGAQWRRILWLSACTGKNRLEKEYVASYWTFVRRADSLRHEGASYCLNSIESDVDRTFVGSNSCGIEGSVDDLVQSLRNVLSAYIILDPIIGYCQGMNFVAGMLIRMMPEPEAFWVLVGLMKSTGKKNKRGHCLDRIFSPGLLFPRICLRAHEILLRRHLPGLAEQLAAEGIVADFYATDMFMCIFSNLQVISLGVAVRVFDWFMVAGWKAVHRVILALLKHHSESDSSAEAGENRFVLQSLREQRVRTVSANSLLSSARRMKVTRRQIRALENWAKAKIVTLDNASS